MKKNVVILGAGGHAKVVAEIVNKMGDNVVGFLDDDENIQGNEIYLGKKVLGKISDIDKYNDSYVIFGIGSNRVRKMISERYNLKWYTAIHPSAVIANDIKIGEGTVVMPGVVINPGTRIGKHCIINTSSSLDHDNDIGDFVHISPGAHLAGTVVVKENCWICTGVSIINNITINRNNVIGAGSLVLNDIKEENGVYVGAPIRKID